MSPDVESCDWVPIQNPLMFTEGGDADGAVGAVGVVKLADLVVLDRDYLTAPAGQIKDIKPMLTMVGGRVVDDVNAVTATK